MTRLRNDALSEALAAVQELQRQVWRLEAENLRLKREVARQRHITRCTLSAVADFGGAIAMDRCTGFGPAAPEVVMDLVEAVARARDEARRPVLAGPISGRAS